MIDPCGQYREIENDAIVVTGEAILYEGDNCGTSDEDGSVPIHKSHLSEPARLCRLLIASCLAYLWIVYLGVCATQKDWMQQLHRQDRCDLSLFRLGLRLLARALKDHLPIPDGFLVPVGLAKPLIRIFQKQAA
jgi:hypothetical protein